MDYAYFLEPFATACEALSIVEQIKWRETYTLVAKMAEGTEHEWKFSCSTNHIKY
jgi:hypothetical protein